MVKLTTERNNYEDLAKLLAEYGELRSVRIVDDGFEISDLLLNGDGELRLECKEKITSGDLAEEFSFYHSYTSCKHPLFKSRQEILKDKSKALGKVESWIDMYVYEPTDNSFIEHADYVLENIDFSKLNTYDYQEGVIKFIEVAKESGQNEFHFICRNNHDKDYIKKILLDYGDIKYVYRDDKENIYIKNLFLDGNGEPTLECSSAFTGKMFESLIERASYNYIGDTHNFLEVLYEFSPEKARYLKLKALEYAEDTIEFDRHVRYHTKFYEFIDFFLSKVNVKELSLLNQAEGILDFIESSKKETFFIVKF